LRDLRVSAIGAAAILAETGDPTRFTGVIAARALVKHAGLAPREKLSGTFTGRTKLTGQGRPKLRLAAWRAVWAALQTNTVYATRYRHLTTRDTSRLTATQAQTVIAGRDPAAPARGDHHRHRLGPADRHPRHPTQTGHHHGRLTQHA
jgi:transposase